MNLGMQIKLKRVQAGMNQSQLAKILGTSQLIVSLWERGRHQPQEKYLKKLNAVLNLDPLAMYSYKQLKFRGRRS